MSEAEPSEIVLVDKAARSGRRLKDVAGIQVALDQIGSVQNITLTRLARSRRVVFVEGDDFALLRKFARIEGLLELASGIDIVAIELGGFSGWEKARNVAWGLDRTLGTTLLLATVLDRDYFCEEEIEKVRNNLSPHMQFVHIHARKEIENYMLVPAALERAVRTNMQTPTAIDVRQMLDAITKDMETDVASQVVAKRCNFLRSSGKDQATITQETLKSFRKQWNRLEDRLSVVPGKEVLSRLRETLQTHYAVNLTDSRILAAFRREDIPSDLKVLLQSLEEFRKLAAGNGEES
jgi:hypothetical protein